MLSHVCYCLQRNVSKRWPENEIVKPRVVSGFIFLRLLCPAIINPKAFHLVADVPPPEIQDTLKLVAKSLMNLANLVEVGAKGQVYMEAIGPFIVDNKQRMVAFLNDLSVSFLLSSTFVDWARMPVKYVVKIINLRCPDLLCVFFTASKIIFRSRSFYIATVSFQDSIPDVFSLFKANHLPVSFSVLSFLFLLVPIQN